MTKKGLPPDTWCRSRAGRPVRRASVSTAVSDSGAGSIRRRTSGGMAPRALRTSGRSVSASVRHVITRQPRERARRRPRSATRSSVASSAQCTSSTTRIDRERVSSSRTAASSDSRDPSASSASDERTAGVARHVAKRPERARRDERIARAPEDATRSRPPRRPRRRALSCRSRPRRRRPRRAPPCEMRRMPISGGSARPHAPVAPRHGDPRRPPGGCGTCRAGPTPASRRRDAPC